MLGWWFAGILFLFWLLNIALIELVGGWGTLGFWAFCFLWMLIKDIIK